jgi:hypothetical protein
LTILVDKDKYVKVLLNLQGLQFDKHIAYWPLKQPKWLIAVNVIEISPAHIEVH